METIKQKDALRRLYGFLCSGEYVMKVLLEEWKQIVVVTKFPLTTVNGTEIWQVDYDEEYGEKIEKAFDMGCIGYWFPEKKKFLSPRYRIFNIADFINGEPWIEGSDNAVNSVYQKVSDEIYGRLMMMYPTLESFEEAGIFPAYDYEKSWPDALWRLLHDGKVELGEHVSWKINQSVPLVELLEMYVNDDAEHRERLEDDLLDDKEMLDRHLSDIRKKYDFERTSSFLRVQPPNEDVKRSLEIHDAILRGHYEDVKTFRVFCREDGIEVAYTADADKLRHMQTYLPDRDFKTPRPQWGIYAKDILRITYGKSVVYEKGSI